MLVGLPLVLLALLAAKHAGALSPRMVGLGVLLVWSVSLSLCGLSFARANEAHS